jgi:hypothetical protein
MMLRSELSISIMMHNQTFSQYHVLDGIVIIRAWPAYDTAIGWSSAINMHSLGTDKDEAGISQQERHLSLAHSLTPIAPSHLQK